VGDAISMDVVRRNAIYQNKGSDDKNASFLASSPAPETVTTPHSSNS